MSELFAVVGHFLRPLSYSILCKSADFKMPWQAIETLHASCGDTFFVLMFIWFSAWPLHFAFPIFLFAANSQQLVANTGNFVPPACLGFPSFSFAIPCISFSYISNFVFFCTSAAILFDAVQFFQECWTLGVVGVGEGVGGRRVTKYAQIFIRTSICGGGAACSAVVASIASLHLLKLGVFHVFA